MQFFVPFAENLEQAELAYLVFVKFNDALLHSRRIFKLSWRNGAKSMDCEIGGDLPSHYGISDEVVLAILDCGLLYKICTKNRGGVRGEAVFISKDSFSMPSYFDQE